MTEARAREASKAKVDGKPSDKPLEPKKVVKRAQELVREATLLLKKKRKKVDAARVAEVEGQLAKTKELLVDKKVALQRHKDVLQASIELDSGLERYFGRWRKSQLRELVEAIVWAIGLAIIIRCFLIEAFSIPSASMYPTLEIGDHLFVSKISYGLYWPFSTHRAIEWGQPVSRGDIIVFEYRYPDPDGTDPLVNKAGYERDETDGVDFIKRVIGLPGDRVRLVDNTVWLNGEPIQTVEKEKKLCNLYGEDDDRTPRGACSCVVQTETIGSKSWNTQHYTDVCRVGRNNIVGPHPNWPLENRPPDAYPYLGGKDHGNPTWPDVVVPEGHVFVMGDNRDSSKDGRFWGFVPFNRIKGKAFVIWANFGDFTGRFGNWLD